ncbi:hypothetical protein FB451DRAFT_1406174 [Mycena latifolia]|nr:hypothetical protein FB451DRAFT_1406174 [Mycena latifolia]
MNSARKYSASKAATRVRKKRRHSASPPRVPPPEAALCAPSSNLTPDGLPIPDIPHLSASIAGIRRRRDSEPVVADSDKNLTMYEDAKWEAGWQEAMAEINGIWRSIAAGEVQDLENDFGATDGEGPERRWAANPWDVTYLAARDQQWLNSVDIATNMMSEPDRRRMILDQHREERLERSRAEHYRFHSSQLTWRPQQLPTRDMGPGRRRDAIDDMWTTGPFVNFYAERQQDEISHTHLSTGEWNDFSGNSGEYID